MVKTLRGHRENLVACGCDPDVLVAAIYLSDLGKERHVMDRFIHFYEGDRFKAFLDHARISMKFGNELRQKRGLSGTRWRKVLTSIMGHDGPSIPGSWWKTHYETELKRRYPGVHGLEGLIHCYLDRIDQGGIFRGRNGQLNGGLRKISNDLYLNSRIAGDMCAVIAEVFGPARFGTFDQLEFLDEKVRPDVLKGRKFPLVIDDLKRQFIESDRYLNRVIIGGKDNPRVEIILDSGEKHVARTLEEFWRILSGIRPEAQVAEMCPVKRAG
ncbi:MAG: hypothetical protein EOP09_20310 [Proteobacteria bacterium]|nr:MAG: hypothetical protein EOP09_20310 [Pseudomonadota bacterium]